MLFLVPYLILDLAPPVIIGLAVDIVVKEQNSWIAGFGIKEVPAQLIFLAFASGIVWSGESSFEYLYSILWRNLAQLSQHKLRIRAYDCLLYTSPSPRDPKTSRMPSSA